jgi:DNA-binding transcriptional LysR family regulator
VIPAALRVWVEDMVECQLTRRFILGGPSCVLKSQSVTVQLHCDASFEMKKALLGQVGDADVRLLRVFKTVVECGGLAAAELELNIGLSTVSRHLKDLEERLGLVLCRRGRVGFALTPEGQRIYESALRVLGSLDAFRTDVGDLHDGLVGSLTIGIFDKTATNSRARIPQAIRAFRTKARDVQLEVTVGTLSQIESAVIDGRFHLGIVPEHRRSESLAYEQLFSETMYLYCGTQHPLFGADHSQLDWSALQDHDYAGLAFHSPNMEATHRFHLLRKASVSDQEAVATLILSGCFVGFLPDHYAASFVQAGLMTRVEHPECMYLVDFFAIQRKSREPARIAQAFAACLRAAHLG